MKEYDMVSKRIKKYIDEIDYLDHNIKHIGSIILEQQHKKDNTKPIKSYSDSELIEVGQKALINPNNWSEWRNAIGHFTRGGNVKSLQLYNRTQRFEYESLCKIMTTIADSVLEKEFNLKESNTDNSDFKIIST